jgi:hypothetical protein
MFVQERRVEDDVGGVLQRYKLPSARQVDRIFEWAPTSSLWPSGEKPRAGLSEPNVCPALVQH